MTENPTKTKALELAIQGGGTSEEVVKRATVYHGFLTNTTLSAPTGANKPGATGAAPATVKGATADPKAGAGKADPKAGAGTPDPKAGASKANGATPPKGATADPKAGAAAAPKAGAAKGANPPSAQSIPADTKAPGGKHTYADVVAMLHKVQNSPAGRPECFKILLEDGGGAKSVRDLKPASYDAVVEACTNIIADEGEPAGEGGDALGDLDALSGGGEQPDLGV